MSRLAGHTPEEWADPSTGSGIESIAVQVDALIAQLSSSDGGERLTAREGLARLGKPAVAPLLAALADQRNHIR